MRTTAGMLPCRRAIRRRHYLLCSAMARAAESPESPSCGLTAAASALRAMLLPRMVRCHASRLAPCALHPALCAPHRRAPITAAARLPRRRGCRCSGGVRRVAARRQRVQPACAPGRPLPLPRPARGSRSQGRGIRRAGPLLRPRRTRGRRRARRRGGQRACCCQPQASAGACAHGPAAGHRQATAAEDACELDAPLGRDEGANRARRAEAAPDEQQ